MAVKREIHEVCPKCGEVQARLLSVSESHNCPKAPPGPPNPPRRYRPSDVIFHPKEKP